MGAKLNTYVNTNLTDQMAKLNTYVNTNLVDEVAKLNTYVTTNLADKNQDLTQQVAALTQQVNNMTKSYLRIQLKLTSTWAEYKSTKLAATCEAETELESNADEYILCCAKSGASTETHLAKYTGSGTGSSFAAAKQACLMADPNAAGDIVSLCNEDQFKNLATSAEAPTKTLAYFMAPPSAKPLT